MNDHTIDRLKDEAVRATVHWGRTGGERLAMRDAVNAYMEACGANRMHFDGMEGVRVRRNIVALRIAIDCIATLTREQLHKVDAGLK